MSVRWTLQARESLQTILLHIAADDPAAAHALIDQVVDSTEATLGAHPMAGRPGRVAGTREWVAHRSYVVAYRVTAWGDVDVLDVVHGARLWPGQF